jgi:hypothetical protein
MSFLRFLLTGSILFFSNLLLAKDTTYVQYFSFRGVPFEARLKEVVDHYELTLFGNKLHVHSASHEGNNTLVLDSFEETATATPARNLPYSVTAEQFRTTFFTLLTGHSVRPAALSSADLLALYNQDPALQTTVMSLYGKLKDENAAASVVKRAAALEKVKREEISLAIKGHKDSMDSILRVIEMAYEGGEIGGKFLWRDTFHRGIPIYTSSDSNRRAYDMNKIRFYPTSVLIRTFNNYIDYIGVTGQVWEYGQRTEVSFHNDYYSLPFKSTKTRQDFLAFTSLSLLNDSLTTPQTDSMNRQRRFEDSVLRLHDTLRRGLDPYRYRGVVTKKAYLVNVADLLDIGRHEDQQTYMIRNGSYLLTRDKMAAPYLRRGFYDYLSITTFLDFLGVVEKTPNSLIQIDGRLRCPLRLMNSRFLGSQDYIRPSVFFPKLDAYLNVAFINGSQSDNRYGTILNQSASGSGSDTLYIDNFDLIRKNNIRTGLELGLLKTELKQSHLNFYLDYGLHFARTSLRYTVVDTQEVDEVNRFNTWSFNHGPIIRFEFRPDQPFGADLSFSANVRQQLLNNDNDNLRVFEVKGPLNVNAARSNPILPIRGGEKANYKFEFNAYFMTNPGRSNGGVYFRMSNYFSHDFRQIFPQVLVGYSTRLTGMINNLKGARTL